MMTDDRGPELYWVLATHKIPLNARLKRNNIIFEPCDSFKILKDKLKGKESADELIKIFLSHLTSCWHVDCLKRRDYWFSDDDIESTIFGECATAEECKRRIND